MDAKKIKFYAYLIVKRLIDIIGACVGLALFGIAYLVLAILDQFGNDKGPIIFKQQRYGLYGKPFTIYKFRSMRVDAEEVLHEDQELWDKYVANNYKLRPEEDPRITKLGRIIRKLSIDELPQFINVLKGDMSLVGPRPIVADELVMYGDRRDAFLKMKPGITGVWGISGRSDLEYPERCDVELSYLDKRSTWFDIYALWETVYQVINHHHKGAAY